MSDRGAVLAGAWFVLIGLAWSYFIFRPVFMRIRERPRPQQSEPVGDQLRMIAVIVLCSALFVGGFYGLASVSPLAAAAVAPFVFYGALTMLLRHLERAPARLGSRST